MRVSPKPKPSDIEEMIGFCALVTVIVERVERRRAKGDKGIQDRELQMIYVAAMRSIRVGMKAMEKRGRGL